jgi:hypothetical protein
LLNSSLPNNLHAAEQDYGREHIDRKIAASRRRNHRAAETVLGLW